MTFSDALTSFDDILYTWLLIYMLAGAGIYFTVKTGFVQIRLLKEAFNCMFEKKQDEKGVSSFQALMIATASRVGTGNMAGVATAIMAGGPAYYIEKALNARWLGIIFAISLITTFAFGFNGLQAYNIVSAFQYYVPDFEHSNIPLAVGIILCVICLILFFGGTEKIGWISSILVPVMAGMYILIGLLIIILNFGKIPAVFAEIFRSAFDFRAIFGGFTGSCMVYGIKRGLFSNEAGMGSAPNASASATVSHPAKQGLAQIISVYIDTLIICSTTVFILLLTGEYAGGKYDGIPLIQQSVASQFGSFSIHIITAAVCLFAFTSIIGNYFYAESNIRFISKNRIFLSKIAFKALKDYEKKKAEGKDPVFREYDIGLDNTDVWH